MPETGGFTTELPRLDALLNDPRVAADRRGDREQISLRLGLLAGDAPELLNLQRPEMVKTVYREAISGGADLILTNSFGGNRARLKLHGAEDQVRETYAGFRRNWPTKP